jgi:hypothetical protein
MKALDGIRSHPTSNFFVLGLKDDKLSAKVSVDNSSSLSNPSQTMKSIFLDIDDPYTLKLIQKAFAHPSRAQNFRIVLGSGEGMDFVQLPANCDFQWAE